MLSLICPRHCSHRGTETGAACLSCHLKLQTYSWGACRESSAALLRKCERLQIAGRQKGLAWKDVAQPHLPAHGTAQTEAQRLGLLVCLATSNFNRRLVGPCQTPRAALLRKRERLQIARREKGLAWKAVAQPHLPTALLAQRHRDLRCLLVLPSQTSNVAYGVRAGSLRQSCSENANVCR